MTIELIEIAKLSKSPLNVRKTTSKAACEELKASLMAHGLMQNLVVVPAKKGKYHVIAGARRLAALQELIAEGKLPAGHAVPCQIAPGEQAQEMSLAENTVRHAMHPADEFEAFAALVDGGLTATLVAERFGTTEKHVLQRLRLGRVAPELLAEYRAGEVDLECLMAFTVSDDPKRQVSVYKSLQGWQKGNARHIRACLTEQMTDADDKLAEFVGLDAYEAAGGRTKADLFGEDVYLEDTALLNRLAGERLEAEAEMVRAEGWGWVEVDFECGYGTLSKFGRIQPQPLDAPAEIVAELEAARAAHQAATDAWESLDDDEESDGPYEAMEAAERRVEDVEAKLESFVDFDPEQKKLAGCFVSISHGGNLSVEKGLVRPEDRKAAAKTEGEKPEEASEAKPALSATLKADLEAYRTQVAQVAIAENPAIAFDLLVFGVAKGTLDHGSRFDGPDVSFRDQYNGRPSKARERLEAMEAALPVDWMQAKTEAGQFAAFQRLPDADKHRLLAHCTALTLRPKLALGMERTAYDLALVQTGVDVAEYWRPTAANYLSRITREQLLEIGRQVFLGGDQWAGRKKDAKKAALVAELDEAFAKSHLPDTIDRLKSWLPAGMAFGEPAQADQAEKAA